jgi:DNA-binding response OmpR family regulator
VASKEILTREGWDLRNYSPRRDDPRVQMAMSRLRRVLEEDPQRPSVLSTTEDGYRLTSSFWTVG